MHNETILKLLSGEWVDTDRVQEALGMSFNECFSMFEFSRTAEWWSVVGETEEERAREGQKIVTKFRLKNCDNGWIPCNERLPEDGTYLCTLDGELCGLDEPFTGMCGIENGVWDEPDCVIAWRPLPEPYQEGE